MEHPERMLIVHCDDWPVAAAGQSSHVPAVVVRANTVVSVTRAAAEVGVGPGQRRREARARCPELVVLDEDPAMELRRFDPIVDVIAAVAPRIEVLRPGSCAIPTLGPSRYFGGDAALAQHVELLVTEALRDQGIDSHCRVGVADGVFAAGLAARTSTIVAAGESPDFLAEQDIAVFDDREFVDLLRRLGLRRVGDFAALPVADVLDRFGWRGAQLQQLATGGETHVLREREVLGDWSVGTELDPPLTQVHTAAFVAKSLADALHRKLEAAAMGCVCLVIEAGLSSGEVLSRVWRHEGELSPVAIAERVRWQLSSWITRQEGVLPEGDSDGDYDGDGFGEGVGIVRIRLLPEDVTFVRGRQIGLWQKVTTTDDRIARALTRVQGMIGEEGVSMAVLGGGRDARQQAKLVPWGCSRQPALPGLPANLTVSLGEHLEWSALTVATRTRRETPTWPGQLPGPAPATVYRNRRRAWVVDANDDPVSVNERGLLRSTPHLLAIDDSPFREVVSWAGPWLLDERWWDLQRHRRCARFQLVTVDGAHLATLEHGTWWIEACYD